LVLVEKLQTTQPLGTLPEVGSFQVWFTGDITNDTPQWVTMIRRDWLSVEVSSQEKIILQDDLQGKVDCKTIFGMLEDVLRSGLS